MKKRVDSGVVRQSFSHGRSKSVAVEVKKRRVPGKPEADAGAARKAEQGAGAPPKPRARDTGSKSGGPVVLKPLTDNEKNARVRALADIQEGGGRGASAR